MSNKSEITTAKKKKKDDKISSVQIEDVLPSQNHGKLKKAKKRHAKDSQCVEKDEKLPKISKRDSVHEPLMVIDRKEKRKDKFKDKVPDFLKLLKSKQIPVAKEVQQISKTAEDIQLETMKEEKRERMRKKRIAKKALKKQKTESTVAKDAALQYLSLWNSNRDAWRFQKVRQVWLLGHMYDDQNVSDDKFDVLLKYLENLKGHGRVETIEEAEKILGEAERKDSKHGDSDKSSEDSDNSDKGSEDEGSKDITQTKSMNSERDVTTTKKYQRARQILQILG